MSKTFTDKLSDKLETMQRPQTSAQNGAACFYMVKNPG